MIVQTLPGDLSQGARTLYEIAAHRCGGTLQFARDWEQEHQDPRTRQRVKPDPSFIPELVAAGLATTSKSYSDDPYPMLWVTQVHPLYSNLSDDADKRDYGMYIEISVIDDEYAMTDRLLLTLDGAEIFERAGRGRYNVPSWEIRLRHDSARDMEHDSAHVADLAVDNPVFTRIDQTGTTFLGRLSSIRYYEHGTSPLTVEDVEECDSDYCSDPHPITEYLPPENPKQTALIGSLVKVTILDRAVVDAAGRHINSQKD